MQRIKIGGKLRPFNFGTNATILLCDELGVELSEFQKKFKSQDVGFFRDCIWAGLQSAEYSSGGDTVYNKYQVGDWIDSLSKEDMDKIVKAMSISVREKKTKKTTAQRKAQLQKQ